MKEYQWLLGVVISVFVLLTYGFEGIASAATISVKQLGCGSGSECYTSISTAITNAQDGDTIKVYPGRYEEAVVIDKNLRLEGSGPQVTTIYSSNGNGISVNSNMTADILGFTITAAGTGIYVNNGVTTNVTIRNNCIVSNGARGIGAGGSSGRITIINNVISYNGGSGIECTNGEFGAAHNNIINSNGGRGIYFMYTSERVRSYNNSYANATSDFPSASTGDISISPSFIEPNSGNYALQNTSASKNAGRPGAADADPDGTRNDMGAYGGPDAASFWPYPQGAPVITNLTVTPTSVQKGEIITINATGEVR